MRQALKSLTLALLLSIAFISNAQIQLQFKNSPLVNFSSDDVVEVIINSVLDKPVNVFLKASVLKDGKIKVVEYQTGAFALQPGVTLLDKNELVIRNKRYFNNDLGSYEVTNGYLPSGEYSYCVSLHCADKACLNALPILLEGEIQICNGITTISPTPLLLSYPADGAKLKIVRPDFNWIPPMPIGADPNINYSFTLVELREKQSGETGIKRNVPLYRELGIQAVALPFPTELPDLIIGKKYAWQVEAFLGSTHIQASEVWEFEIIQEEEKVFPMPYVRLKLGDESIYTAVNQLKFVFYRESYEKQLKYEIRSIEGNPVPVDLPPLKTILGENKFALDLTGIGLEHNKFYLLSVQGENQAVYTLKFRYYFKKELK